MNTARHHVSSRVEHENTPHPYILYLPFHRPQTREGQDYIRWEQQQIRMWLAQQPDPKAPVTQAQFDAERLERKELERVQRDIMVNRAPTFPTLPPGEQATVSARLANACWRQKVLRCRTTRVYEFPPEIVVHVLDFLLDENLEANRVRLAAVCRQWREIVIKKPRLWQDVWLNDKAPHTVSASFMERAKSLPLSIRIGERRPRPNGPSDPLTPEEMYSQLDVVLPKLDQIRNLMVVLKSWDTCLAFLERAHSCSVAPSLLESFRIHRTTAGYGTPETIWSATDSGRYLLLFNGRATRLRQLTVDGIHLDWDMPLSELDVLDLRRMPLAVMPKWTRFSEVVHLSPHLRELSLDGCSPQFSLVDGNLPGQRILLPNLRTLLIGGMSIPFLIRMAYLLDTPRVVELILKNYEPDTDWAPVFKMLTGSYPLVRILQLNAVRVSSQPQASGAMARFFMSMKNIELVRLYDMHESFLNFLLDDGRYYLDPATPPVMTSAMRHAIEAEHPEPLRILPALKTVVYDGILTQEVIRFANARRTLGLPLNRVYAQLAWYYTLSVQDKRALSQLPGFRPLLVALQARASPEEQAIWHDVEGAGAGIRNSRV